MMGLGDSGQTDQTILAWPDQSTGQRGGRRLSFPEVGVSQQWVSPVLQNAESIRVNQA